MTVTALYSKASIGRTLVCFCVFLAISIPFTSFAVGKSQRGREPATDHLLPVDGEIDSAYLRLLQRKLFVTHADYGRILVIIGTLEGERAISIYSDPRSRTGVRMTCTKANQNIGIAGSRSNAVTKNSSGIGIARVDCEISKATAESILKSVSTMLHETRERVFSGRAEDIVVDGRSLEFSIGNGRNKIAPGFLPPDVVGRKVDDLRRLTDLLISYCQPNSEKQKLAKQIRFTSDRINK